MFIFTNPFKEFVTEEVSGNTVRAPSLVSIVQERPSPAPRSSGRAWYGHDHESAVGGRSHFFLAKIFFS